MPLGVGRGLTPARLPRAAENRRGRFSGASPRTRLIFPDLERPRTLPSGLAAEGAAVSLAGRSSKMFAGSFLAGLCCLEGERRWGLSGDCSGGLADNSVLGLLGDFPAADLERERCFNSVAGGGTHREGWGLSGDSTFEDLEQERAFGLSGDSALEDLEHERLAGVSALAERRLGLTGDLALGDLERELFGLGLSANSSAILRNALSTERD